MLNLSVRKLTDTEYTLLGKGLGFCPRIQSHDKVKLAEEVFQYTRRLRLKEYFADFNKNDKNETVDNDEYKHLPFFNKKSSTFTPPSGRDVYLDFYIEAVTNEILHSVKKKRFRPNISKKEMHALQTLAHDDTIVIKKADKSNTIVVMDKNKYTEEINRQLNNETYYKKVDENRHETSKQNIKNCVEEIKHHNAGIERHFDMFPSTIRTPQFYILPKTHKEFDDNLPLGFPGRPIVSAYNSSTENISKYLDSILNPYVQCLSSYVKDTTDFISKVKNIKLEKDSYFVTMDVSSLYTNIPHNDGIDACSYFINKDVSNTNVNADDISKLLKLVLENNCFDFNNQTFLQTMGTAMGSSMAPSYASLFMGKLEEEFLNLMPLKPDVWLRFLDDIFMIWNGSLEDLRSFIDALNSYHSHIKFTHCISTQSVSFLDVSISKGDSGAVITDIFCKPTNMHLYLDFSSSHPMSCKRGIPYSQAKRYRRIISNDDEFSQSLVSLQNYFVDRNYPTHVIADGLSRVKNMSQDDALCITQKSTSSVIPFTVCFNTSLPNIGDIVHKYWDLLQLSGKESVRSLHDCKPILAYRRPKNIKDCLVKSAMYNKSFSSNKCHRRRCTHCENISTSSQFSSNITGLSYNLHFDVDCTSRDVIYLVTCKHCNIQYVGQTNQNVSRRMNSHRFDIKNCLINPISHVATHFGSLDSKCSLSDFSFLPIDVVNNNLDRLCKETFWIHKLKTMLPNGLNNKLLYDI